MKFIFVFTLVIISAFCGYSQKDKINGISLVSANKPLSSANIDPLVQVSANYAAVIPFGFMSSVNSTSIQYDVKEQWYGETMEGIKSSIKLLQDREINIMIKPQIWISNGAYTGDIRMRSEKEWRLLEHSYTEFITCYAKIAAEVNAEFFCVGTELKLFASNRPEYWRGLISDLKVIYKGKLTYAANWDEYIKVRFWDNLDYIGIDAYFPVSFKKTPTVEDCLKGWKKNMSSIKYVSKAYDKQVLFTEYGYRSMDYTGKEPWNSDKNITKVNLEAQTNATQALMEMFWDKEWFAGGFLWKWYPGDENAGGRENSRFTPQNKPVLKVIQSFFSKDPANPENK